MTRAKFALFFAVATLAAACQPTTGSVPAAPADQPPTAAPSPAAPSSAAPSPSPSAALRRVLVTGKVYDDEGTPIDGAQVEVRSVQYPELNQTVEAHGGAYVVADVPERAALTLVASKPGYTARTRVVEALILPDGAGYDPNRFDFGGFERGMRHALSKYPEIAEVIPANGAKGVTSNPLRVSMRFSHALPSDQRGLFEGLLKLRFRAGGETYELYPRLAYGNDVARFDWDEDGRGGTFVFEGPLVTRSNAETAVTVALDQGVALTQWPEDAQGRVLGRGVAPVTAEGSGADVRNQVAAFLRPTFDGTLPSSRPEALTLWGQTHQTTSLFTLAQEAATLKVVKAEAVPAQGTMPDRFVVTFDRPVRGFPEKALDGSALKQSHYRFVLGTTEKRDDTESFEAKDPRTGGTTPDGAAPYYSSTNPHVVILPLSGSRLSSYTNFKLYVDAAVKDASGNGLASEGAVLEGTI